MSDPYAGPNLGPCCVCETTYQVVEVWSLNGLCPMPGRGWGCVACGLAPNGAVAVVCATCADWARRSRLSPVTFLKWACRGYPGVDGRVPMGEIVGTWGHDMRYHPGEAPAEGDHHGSG